MKHYTNETLKNKYVLYISIMLFFAFAFIFPYFSADYSGDNYWISMVIGGFVYEDTQISFMNPIITLLIRGLNRIWKNANWFWIIQETISFLCFTTVSMALYRKIKNHRRFAYAELSFFLFSIAINAPHANFTIASAYFACIGWFLLICVIKKSIPAKYLLPASVFTTFSVLFRYEAFFLTVPYFILSVVLLYMRSVPAQSAKTSLWETVKRTIGHLIRSAWRPAAAVIAGPVISMIVFYAVLVAGPYRQTWSMNKARAAVADGYTYESVDEAKNQLEEAGYSTNDYYALKNLNLTDRDVLTENYFREIADIVGNACERPVTIAECTVLPIALLLKPWTNILWLLYLIPLFIFVLPKRKFGKMGVILALTGTYLISFYFSFCGRMPTRVLVPLFIGTMLVILSPAFEQMDSYHESPGIIRLSLITLLMIQICATSYLFSPIPRNPFSFGENRIIPAIESYVGNENFYVWDVNHSRRIIKEYMSEGKRLPEEFMDNNIFTGEWTFGMQGEEKYLESLNASNPAKKLIEDDNCYYVGDEEDAKKMKTYLEEHFGKVLKCTFIRSTETSFGAPCYIWKFSEKEKD